IASLSSGFNNAAQADPNLSEHSKARVAELSADGVEIVTGDQLTEAAEANGLSARDVEQLSQHYGEAQIQSIKD
ncbi:MFS transporter, partial [Streptomyces sp. SID10244]|nr:MFS transporter [Streptomyces sp. SID10244]